MAILNLANLSFYSRHLAGASKLIGSGGLNLGMIGIPKNTKAVYVLFKTDQFHNHMCFALLTLVSHVNPTKS